MVPLTNHYFTFLLENRKDTSSDMLDQIHSPLRADLISSSLQPMPSNTRAAGSGALPRLGKHWGHVEKVGKSRLNAGKSGEILEKMGFSRFPKEDVPYSAHLSQIER
jgi:hypothetical protein